MTTPIAKPTPDGYARVTWHCKVLRYLGWAEWNGHKGAYDVFVEHEHVGSSPTLNGARMAVRSRFAGLIAAEDQQEAA